MNFQTGSPRREPAITYFLAMLFAASLAPAQRSITGKVEKVVDGFQFVEGPVWKDGIGLLLASFPSTTCSVC